MTHHRCLPVGCHARASWCVSSRAATKGSGTSLAADPLGLRRCKPQFEMSAALSAPFTPARGGIGGTCLSAGAFIVITPR